MNRLDPMRRPLRCAWWLWAGVLLIQSRAVNAETLAEFCADGSSCVDFDAAVRQVRAAPPTFASRGIGDGYTFITLLDGFTGSKRYFLTDGKLFAASTWGCTSESNWGPVPATSSERVVEDFHEFDCAQQRLPFASLIRGDVADVIDEEAGTSNVFGPGSRSKWWPAPLSISATFQGLARSREQRMTNVLFMFFGRAGIELSEPGPVEGLVSLREPAAPLAVLSVELTKDGPIDLPLELTCRNSPWLKGVVKLQRYTRGKLSLARIEDVVELERHEVKPSSWCEMEPTAPGCVAP